MGSGKQSFNYNLDNIEQTCQMAKALSSPIRLEILKLLIDKSMTMGELAQILYVSVSSVSMHTKVLQDAELITITPKPGKHGAQKVCGIKADKVVFDLFGVSGSVTKRSAKVMNISVGNYSEAEVNDPCGLVSIEDYVDIEDTRYGFYDPAHIDAQLIWFTSGYLKYHISNKYLAVKEVKSLNISFEVCAEAPGYNNTWPSDIYLKINDVLLHTFRVSGDYGGIRGINNPDWWSDSNTQYGELKMLSITKSGTFFNGKLISKRNIKSLKVSENYYFTFEIGVDKDSECPGGLNLFGGKFGNYAQDIRVEVQYN
ncbi:ArsR family transcriptional regulator [Anaerocolumna sedimenticola]|uniref:ArsR family transcriptional regulator n=1 Tax=Anaerocolumna sedimenticola TaxID=2696063 RepID=A0A6P1TEF7_9FIRM|nr:ArsR family transcriptional regulator [Anaerocolumna sedimenticola]QHQ59620.1 ArsR family transcriptional regulator [Anaerocolumna sedimenticola]